MSVSSTPINRPVKSGWWNSRTFRRFVRHRLAALGVVMVILLTLACVIGPYLLPYNDLYIDLACAIFSAAHRLSFSRHRSAWAVTSRRAC